MSKPTVIRFGFFLSIICSCLISQAQQTWLPRVPSPAATVSQTIGISSVRVSYSRPSVKGREIWGKLVPYGWDKAGSAVGLESPWRAGANENTILHLSNPATIQGTLVPAGDYGLFFVVNQDNTGLVILSKDFKSWGSFFYDPKQDQMRAKITIRDMPASTERLTYSFDNMDKNSIELELNWEKKQFPVKIEFAVDQIVMENTTELLKGETGFYPVNLNAAANYALQNNIDTAQAMQWVNRSIGQGQTFNNLRIKAGIQKIEGDSIAYNNTMKTALQAATENELNNYGYQQLGQNQFPQAIDALKVCTQKFPNSANAFDSLGEAYALAGDKKNAIANFKKSLSMNPTAPTKANSEKYLKQLGAM